jgi:hypothetical protein
MRAILGASGIILSLLLPACSGQGNDQNSGKGKVAAAGSSSGPSSTEVDTYLEGQLPAHLDVDDVKIQNFIDPNTAEGRVSVSASVRFKEAVYRDATDAEILDYLQQHGISQSERQMYVPFNQYRSVNMEHRFLAEVAGSQTKIPASTELHVKKTVEGSGNPLQAFGSGALPMGSPQAEAYLSGAVQQKAATNANENKLQTNVTTLFTPGQSVAIHMMHPNSRKRHEMTFSPDSGATFSTDGKSSFFVTGAVQHANVGTAPYRTGQATRARIAGELGHRQGSLTPNYTLKIQFFDPQRNAFSGGGDIGDASMFDRKIIADDNLYYWHWWTD